MHLRLFGYISRWVILIFAWQICRQSQEVAADLSYRGTNGGDYQYGTSGIYRSSYDNYLGSGRVNANGEVYYPSINRQKKCPTCPDCTSCSGATTQSPVETTPSNTSLFDPTQYTICQFVSWPYVCSPQDCKNTLAASAAQVPYNPLYGQFFIDPIRVSRCQLAKEYFLLTIVRGCWTPDFDDSYSLCYTTTDGVTSYTCVESYFISCKGPSFYSTCLTAYGDEIYTTGVPGCDAVLANDVKIQCSLFFAVNSILSAKGDFTLTVLADNNNC